jgi:Replication-relaxation
MTSNCSATAAQKSIPLLTTPQREYKINDMSRPVRNALQLTPRDLAILQMVARYDGCAVHHLYRRLWNARSCISGCYRRIDVLAAGRYVRKRQLPTLASHGSGKALITLGPRGRRLLSEVLDDSELSALDRRRDVAAFFAEHHFALCDFRVALEQASERLPGFSIDGWVVESTLRRTPIRVTDSGGSNGGPAPTITLIPDAAFQLSSANTSQTAYLEMDMGTITPNRLLQRLRGYLLLTMSPANPIPLFFVTASSVRVAQVLATIDGQAQELHADPTTIFVATRAEAAKDTVLTDPIWHRAGVAKPAAIIPTHETRTDRPHAPVVFQRPAPIDDEKPPRSGMPA